MSGRRPDRVQANPGLAGSGARPGSGARSNLVDARQRLAGARAARVGVRATLGGAAAAAVGAGAYSSFLLAPVVHSRLSAASSFVSELEANGQPHADFFRLTDVVSGLLIILVAAVLHRVLPRDRMVTLGCQLVAVMGVASMTDGATEMGCAPSLNAACRAKDSTVSGLLGQTFESHTLSGLAGFVGGAGGILLLGVALRRYDARWGTASAVLGFALAAVGLVDLGLLAVHHWFGLAERARALLVSLWLLGAAAYLAAAGSRVASATGQRSGSAPSSLS
jgi:hypothetical protein